MYEKPYLISLIWPFKYSLDIEWEKQGMFDHGWKLPCKFPDGDGRNNLNPWVDPTDYDLAFKSIVSLGDLLKYDFLSNTRCIVSQRILDLLNKHCPNDFQAFPVKIVSDIEAKIEPYECDGYHLINITRIIDCVDCEQSEFTYNRTWKGLLRRKSEMKNVNKLVLKETNEKFFLAGTRAKECGFIEKIISQEFADIIKQNEFRGICVQTDYEYHYGPYNDIVPFYYYPDRKKPRTLDEPPEGWEKKKKSNVVI
jgi:hypothetical protein